MENKKVKRVYCDPPQRLQSDRKNLNEQRKTGKHCDFILKTEDGGDLKVHKNVLEAASPFFEKMFNSEFKDNDAESLLLVKVSSLVLDKIIGFMYTREIEVSEDIAKETLDNALFLGLISLVDLCTEILIETANEENCLQLLEYSQTYYCGQNLSKKCIEIIHQNIETVLESPEFLEMYPEAMEMLVSYNSLQDRKEEQLYLAVSKWIEFDIEERKQHLKTLFDKIKFEKISKEFGISKILKDNPLLELKEFQESLADIVSILYLEKTKNNVIHPFRPPAMFSLHGYQIRQYNSERKSFDICITKLRENKVDFADTTVGCENYFICGGRSKRTGALFNTCEYFNMREKKWNDLPPMKETRYDHRSVTLDNKIFVCGGWNTSSMEFFDICKSSWYGGAPLSQDMCDFGLCTLNNCIYAVEQDKFERYDPRSGSWTHLPSLNFIKFFHAIGHGNLIYGFNREWICTFDIRNNRWMDRLVNFEDFAGYPCVYDGKINFVVLKNGIFYLETYGLEDLSLNESNITYGLSYQNFFCRLFSFP